MWIFELVFWIGRSIYWDLVESWRDECIDVEDGDGVC